MITCDVCNTKNAKPREFSWQAIKGVNIDSKVSIDLCQRCEKFFEPEHLKTGIIKYIKGKIETIGYPQV